MLAQNDILLRTEPIWPRKYHHIYTHYKYARRGDAIVRSADTLHVHAVVILPSSRSCILSCCDQLLYGQNYRQMPLLPHCSGSFIEERFFNAWREARAPLPQIYLPIGWSTYFWSHRRVKPINDTIADEARDMVRRKGRQPPIPVSFCC